MPAGQQINGNLTLFTAIDILSPALGEAGRVGLIDVGSVDTMPGFGRLAVSFIGVASISTLSKLEVSSMFLINTTLKPEPDCIELV